MVARPMLSYAILFALLTFVFWGTTNFLIKFGTVNGMDKPQIVAVMWITVGVAGLLFFTYLVLTEQFNLAIDKWLLVPVSAGAFLAIGLLTFTYGVSLGSTGSIAAIATANSAFTAVLAFIVLGEELNLQQMAGIGTILAGIMLLASSH